MQELIERLSKATGPDHAIDIEIARMRGVTVMMQNDDGNGSHEDTYWEYTKSIDDALTLVPEGMKWSCGTWSNNFATCGDDSRSGQNIDNQPSPAIALCIAALKAQQGTTRGE
jgi:hypothetical protein